MEEVRVTSFKSCSPNIENVALEFVTQFSLVQFFRIICIYLYPFVCISFIEIYSPDNFDELLKCTYFQFSLFNDKSGSHFSTTERKKMLNHDFFFSRIREHGIPMEFCIISHSPGISRKNILKLENSIRNIAYGVIFLTFRRGNALRLNCQFSRNQPHGGVFAFERRSRERQISVKSR